MKRDMDVVRDLLLWMEAQDDHLFMLGELPHMGSFNATLAHVQMLESGGYLERTPNGAYRISWLGFEFLDKVRDAEIWRKTKDGAQKVGSWSVKLLGDLATGYIRAKATELGLPI